jgi:hypothetical protein
MGTPAASPTPISTEAETTAGCEPVAFVMINGKSSTRHTVDSCRAEGELTLPEDASPALDNWVSCGPGANPMAWSGDGTDLLYITDYYYSGHGEIHVLDIATGAVRLLAGSYALVDAASGETVGQGCTEVDECHPGEIRDGQITFINSRNPRWSPDGAEIAFETMAFDASNNKAPIFHTFLINRDGSDIRALTDPQAADLLATWAEGPIAPDYRLPLDFESSVDGLDVGCVAPIS